MVKNVGAKDLVDDVELNLTTSNLKTSREPDNDNEMDPKRMGGNTHFNVSRVRKIDGNDSERIMQAVDSASLKCKPCTVTA